MKKSFVFALALIIGAVFTMPGFAQDKKQSDTTAPAVQSETPARSQKKVTPNKVTRKKHQKNKKPAAVEEKK